MFLHGIETVTTVKGPRPVKEVASGIVGLIGLAPTHHVLPASNPPAANAIAALVTPANDARLGPDLPGYTIPSALKDHRAEQGSTVVVINVFNPAVHQTVVADAAHPIAAKRIVLPHGDLISAVVKNGATTCVEGTDYTIDRVTGVISIVDGGALAAATTANVAYVRANPAAVDAEDIIGAVDAGGVRTGLQALLGAKAQLGYAPKILIAPGFTGDAAVQQALLAVASKLRAVVIGDLPAGTTLEDAIASRLPSGSVSAQSVSDRMIYAYPHLRIPRPGGTDLKPFSPTLAASMARTDREVGYWRSLSNRKLEQPTGLELNLSVSLDDPTADVQRLNAAGLVTVYAGGEKGFRVWGNHSASFPGDIGIGTFIAARRTIDMVTEAIEGATFEYLDGSIGDVLIQQVLADVNEYVRTLIGRGALIPGSYVDCRAEDNPTADLQAGRLKFFRADCPPVPAEHITWLHTVDTTLLANIFGG